MKPSEKRKGKQEIKQATRKAKKEILRFYLLFPVFLFIIFFVYPFISPYFNSQLVTISSWTAGLLGFILNLFGINAHTSGPVLALNKLSIRVVSDCLGLSEILILISVIVAFPANYKKKLLGIFFGIPVLYVINFLRVMFIAVLGNWNPKTFKFMHIYFWQVAGILIVGGIWFFWIEKIVKYEKETRDIYS